MTILPLLLAACPGDPMDDPDAGMPDAKVCISSTSASCQEATMESSFTWIENNVFEPSCSRFTSCHMGNNPAEMLNLTPGIGYDQLVNVDSVQVPTMKRVAPGDPENSYLYIKLGGGDRSLLVEETMPYRNPLLCCEKLEAVRRWIEMGANP